MAYKNLAELQRALETGAVTSVEVTTQYLQTIAEKEEATHAFLEVFADALEQAAAADAQRARGEARPLTGVPIAIKDNIVIQDRFATAASKMLVGHRALYDATVIQKLKEQGVVFIGRTNMDEFALGSSTENSAFGPTHNPHAAGYTPGGTSGGSAAAVAAGFVPVALGSDTGGSVRQPASFCGVVGLKPTYGSVSRYGLIAAASSLDVIGPIGHTVADVRTVFDAIRGNDPKDSTTRPDYTMLLDATVSKIGIPKGCMDEGVDADIRAAFEKTVESLRTAGHEIVEVDMPNLKYSLACYYIINPAEVSSNLARFDGIRYGHTVDEKELLKKYMLARAEGLGKEARRRSLVGTFVLSAGYFDAYYNKAMAARKLITEDFKKAFDKVDVLVTPTSPIPAWKFGAKSEDVRTMYAADIFTVSVNLAGVPAISVPTGTVEREGMKLPVGFQIIAPHRREDRLFSLGEEVEQM
jgi:aspartyl-tRNA(Asn)/glutamyl-tRNA(Gln) amidotransferase subunit A